MIIASLREYLDATIKEKKELFAYRNDGRYTIDNNLVELAIRPLICECKVSMFYENHDGADISVGYYTFVESCKWACITDNGM
jgi:hypothetical protein